MQPPTRPQAAVGVPAHAPALQRSPVVQGRPSSQLVPVAAGVRVKASVLSLHTYALHAGAPPGGVRGVVRQPRTSAPLSVGAQTSVPEQKRPSSHTAFEGTCEATPSLQLSMVQLAPSLGTRVSSLLKLQPLGSTHASRVHGLPSLHETGLPPPQTPPLQTSAARQIEVEQLVPFAALACWQTPPTLVSTVHGLPSSQTGT